MAKKTCLYEAHVSAGAKIVDFAGFDMPIQYEGILSEHQATRNAIGIFDVSHMGKFLVEGDNSTKFINSLITNDLSSQSDEQAIYSPMCYKDGGTVDDILVYRYHSNAYLLVVNAANKDKDFEWIDSHRPHDVQLMDVTEELCQIAVQGPKSLELLQSLVDVDLASIQYYWFKNEVVIGGTKALISRTGYTGEDGFELYFDQSKGVEIWNLLLLEGENLGIKPCGLGARDTLRFEAGMPLYGNELSTDINPVEAGLSYFVKSDKKTFIGKEALTHYKNNPLRKLVGFELIDRGLARHGIEIVDTEDLIIGYVTTGYKSPTFGATLGFALIPKSYTKDTLTLKVRNKKIKAKIINKRFLKTYQMED